MGVIAVGELRWPMRQQAPAGSFAEPSRRQNAVHPLHCQTAYQVAAWFSSQLPSSDGAVRPRGTSGPIGRHLSAAAYVAPAIPCGAPLWRSTGAAAE